MEYLTIGSAHDGFFDGAFTCKDLVSYYLDRIRKYDGEGPSRDETGRDPAQPDPDPDPDPVSSKSQEPDPALFERMLQLSEPEATQPPALNAILAISTTALEEAADLDSHLARTNLLRGPLHGIPVIVKDQIETAGLVTTYGSVKAKSHLPREDATVIQKLKDAGAIILAKSTMPDWSASWHCTSTISGTTKNPHDLARDPCSGTGAAIAADFAILGLDTDAGGNIRLPASFCSLVGLRPKPGMISRHGVSPLVLPQDTPGPICRTVKDAALMFDVMVGFDHYDPYTTAVQVAPPPANQSYASTLENAEPANLRIGRVESLFGSDEDERCRPVNELVRSALDNLQAAGANVVSIEIPHLKQYFITTFPYTDQSKCDLDDYFHKSLSNLNLSVDKIYKEKAYHPAQELFEVIAKGSNSRLDPSFALRLRKQEEFRRLIMTKMTEADVEFLAFPTCQITAPLTKEVLDRKWSAAEFPTNTILAGQGILPAISVPVGATEEGLPVGMEFVSFLYREQQLLEAAAVSERLLRGQVRPTLTA